MIHTDGTPTIADPRSDRLVKDTERVLARLPRRIDVGDCEPGDIVRWNAEDPLVRWNAEDPPVLILKVKRDRYGYDVLYDPQNGNEPRWRGFDSQDCVTLIERNQ